MNQILLVDDDRLIRTMYADTLERHGFRSTAVSDGDEALERIRAGDFDAVLSDINMPHLSGLEFLREVRRFRPGLPVVLITSAPALESAVRAVELGAYRYLTKPVAEADLVTAVSEALEAGARARVHAKSRPLAGVSHLTELSAQVDAAAAGLFTVFQPIVVWSGRSVLGFEALARTRAANLSRPDELFAAAERLERVHELGRALRRLLAIEAREVPGDALIFANIHPHDLADADLYDPGAPLSAIAHRVVLEITERASLEAVDRLADRVAELRRLGYRLAVDDLGAGYAGLAAFSSIAPDVVKLDMSLVRSLDSDPRRQAVVASLIGLTRELGTTLVAEGVETAGERDALLALGCDHMQGYLFAMPSPGFRAPMFG